MLVYIHASASDQEGGSQNYLTGLKRIVHSGRIEIPAQTRYTQTGREATPVLMLSAKQTLSERGRVRDSVDAGSDGDPGLSVVFPGAEFTETGWWLVSLSGLTVTPVSVDFRLENSTETPGLFG